MEVILEILASGLAEACCNLIAAGFSSAGAGVTGYKAHQRNKERQHAKEIGAKPPANPYSWATGFLIFLALFLLGFTVYNWLK